jgi:hypothetical protein
MTDLEPTTEARIAVESILEAVAVDRVVYVDDANDKQTSIEDIIAAAISLDTEKIGGVFPELGDHIPDDQDVLRQKIINTWKDLSPETQATRTRDVLLAVRQHDSSGTDDLADVSILSDLVPSAKLISLSPSQWETDKDRFLTESQEKRTLFLFDRDFSDAGGDNEGGIKIIASLFARNDTKNLICGLLTHTVTPENQLEQWVGLSKTHSIPQDRFVVIPKLNLSRAPILFAQSLKFAALSPNFTELKQKTKQIIDTATHKAANYVDKVSIYDLEHIVFQVSADEGLWEPDMLFRLHTLYHRSISRQLAHKDGSLEKISGKLRALSGIPTNNECFTPPSSSWEIQRLELYGSSSYINKNHLPIEIGDFFKRVGAASTKLYVLLAQPCDLMVRNNGKRQPELQRVPIAEIVCTDTPPYYSEEMPYLDSNQTKKWYVNFKAVHFVRPDILDLCVMNQDGVGKLTIGSDAPSGVRPAWKKRHKILTKLVNQAVRKNDLLVPSASDGKAVRQEKESISKKLGNVFFDDDLFKGEIVKNGETRVVTYDCKRIGRISRERAFGLLMSYTASLGRPAFDRDFGVINN